MSDPMPPTPRDFSELEIARLHEAFDTWLALMQAEDAVRPTGAIAQLRASQHPSLQARALAAVGTLLLTALQRDPGVWRVLGPRWQGRATILGERLYRAGLESVRRNQELEAGGDPGVGDPPADADATAPPATPAQPERTSETPPQDGDAPPVPSDEAPPGT